MYKHSALNIKETDDKMFISSSDKAQISEIPTIKNGILELSNEYDEISKKVDTLDKYVHNNDTIICENKEGAHISVANSMEGSIRDIEILGNTIQNATDLTIIKSVGKLRTDGLYEIELTSCGKNLFNGEFIEGAFDHTTGNPDSSRTTTHRSSLIKVKPSTAYIYSTNGVIRNVNVLFYDNSKQLISVGGVMTTSFTTPENCAYIGIYHYKTDSDFPQLEEGTVVSSYEEYKKSVSKITLPQQLEKIDTICDKIFRREDGIWCIEKNIKNIIFNTSLITSTYEPLIGDSEPSGKIQYYADNYLKDSRLDYKVNNVNSFCPSISITDRTKSERIECWNRSTVAFSMPKDLYPTISDFKKVLPETIDFRYVLASPQIIELPLDVQIQLNSFYGVTNVYVESGEIAGIINCKVAKSLGGSVNTLIDNTDNLSNRLSNIETLQESTDINTFAEEGLMLCKDTRNGYITDIKIEGNTLVNLCNVNNIDVPIAPTSHLSDLVRGLKIGREYTVIGFFNTYLNTVNTDGIGLSFTNGVTRSLTISPTSPIVKFIPTSANYTSDTIRVYFPTTQTGAISNVSILILEGDYTNKLNKLAYFKGIKSVGQDNKDGVTITSRDESKSLIPPINTFTINGSHPNVIISEKMVSGTPSDGSFGLIRSVYLEKGAYRCNATTTGDNARIRIFNRGCNSTADILFANIINATFNITKSGIYDIKIENNGKTTAFSIGDISLVKNNTSTTIRLPYTVDKKQVLYKNNEGEYLPLPLLRRVNNDIKDTIEKHSDGKYYYHKRCGEVVLNGSETWTLQFTYDNTLSFICDTYKGTKNNLCRFIADRFEYISKTIDAEGMDMISSKFCYITIPKTKLTTQDLAGFKTWLNLNPVTVVYELGVEEVYECNDIELTSYNNETLVYVNSNPVSAQLSFKSNPYIGDILTNMMKNNENDSRFRESLTDNVTITKECNNGYNIFENTKEGIVNIDKLEGNTLVNLSNNSRISSGGGTTISGNIMTLPKSGYVSFLCTDKQLQGRTLTVKYFAPIEVGNKQLRMIIRYSTASGLVDITPAYEYVDRAVFTVPDVEYTRILIYIQNTGEAEITQEFKILCVEGDYSENMPAYFQGMKSVGSLENSIDIMSNNINLFDTEKVIYNIGIGAGNVIATANNWCYSPDYIPVKKNRTYYIQRGTSISTTGTNDGYIYVYQYLPDLTYTTRIEVGTTGTSFTPSHDGFVRLSLKYSKLINFGIFHNEVIADYDTLKQSKKQILYKTSNGIYEKPILRGIKGGIKDTIEKHSDGKYYYHKRCEELVLNGTETNWTLSADYVNLEGHNTISFQKPIAGILYNSERNYKIECDTIVSKINGGLSTVTIDSEYIQPYSSTSENVGIRVLKTKLATQDIEGFKTWLKSNPATIVYALAVEQVYECTSLDLDSYKDETTISLNTHVPAKIKATIKSNLADTANSIRARINFLENKIMEMFKSLLSGNVQSLAYELYPQDFDESSKNIDDEEIL